MDIGMFKRIKVIENTSQMVPKVAKEKQKQIRINTIITGDPATWLLSWKKRGLVRSNSDAIRQAFAVYNEIIVDRDRRAQQIAS